MKTSISTEIRYRIMFILVVLGLTATVIILPNQFHSKAVNNGSDVSDRTVSQDTRLENYDIRTDKSRTETIIGYRQTAGKDAVSVADARDKFVAGENALRSSVPTLKVEYNEDIRTPEVIAPDVNRGNAALTGASKEKHSDILRRFAADNSNLIGLRSGQSAQLKMTADYTNPNGVLSYARFEQFINDVPVFRGEINAGFTKQGEMFRVINNLAPDLDYNSLSTDFGDPLDAVRAASDNIKFELKSAELVRNEAQSNDLKIVFGTGDSATTAEKMYFPTEPGVARAAWRVLIWEPVNAYYVIVDARSGTILWRKNLSEDQTQSATYNVYTNPLAMMNVAENPTPITPGPTNPGLGIQGTQINRSNVTLIGNEGDLSFNNLGWITDNANGTNGWTDGNNVQAGLDIDGVDGVDASLPGVGRVFNFTYNPAPGIGGAPDAITSTNHRSGAITQLFYIDNRYHDETYKLGFTEAARNFQNDNFGRGGVANDRVRGEAQDSSGTNNANFSSGADGTRGRMQMYAFTQSPARDGDLDGDVVVHEHTHGLSNRLIGNNSGLSSERSRGMGEGWSDFYGLALLSQESDPLMGIYSTGSYVTFNIFGFGSTNSYYGIRRFPYAVMAFTGGPNNRPFNPLTLADLTPGCDLSDGAYAPSSFSNNPCTEVHNAGEIWAVSLWEVRAKFIQRLGWSVGNRRILQFVTDGMKLTPNNPSFIQARDGVIAAARAGGVSADVADVREGFRIRGMGFSATDNGTTAVEAFDQPNVQLANGFTVSDTPGDNDGFPEPGENVFLTVPIVNDSGATINNVAATVTGGGSANYGNLSDGQTVSRQINYTIPSNTACGSLLTVSVNITSNSGNRIETQTFRVGKPIFSGTTQNFDGVIAPTLPVGWSQVNSGGNTGWVTSTIAPSSTPNTAFAPSPASSGQAILNTGVQITSASAQLSFKNSYNTESTWDGMVLEIQLGNGAFQDITAAGGSFVSGGYNITMNAASPFGARPAWSGNSTTFVNTVVNLPAAANGQTINLRWREISDDNTTASGTPGHKIDDVVITGGALLSNYDCSVTNAPTSEASFDFDGDGKSDLAVFRPSNGTWYLSNSQTGFAATQFGQNGDVIAPADYDGDNKTDLAVFRNGIWYLQRSTAGFAQLQFGAAGDVAMPADFDGDSKAELAVFRPSTGVWYTYNLANNQVNSVQFGIANDRPVAADYDGDGKADLAVFRPSNGTWYIQRSTLGFTQIQFGVGTDSAVPADYDGDGKADIAVFRNGTWYLQQSTAGFAQIQFGLSGDVPAPADYDGDGKADLAVFRNGTWYLNRTTAGFTGIAFGIAGDLPAQNAFVR